MRRKEIKIVSASEKAIKIQRLYFFICNKLFGRILCSILKYFDIFEKSNLYLNGKCTLESNILLIVFSVTSCIYYWRLRGEDSIYI
jgi:hypothetical protein